MDCNTLIVIIIFCREPIFITCNHYKIRWLMVSYKATLLIYKLIIGNKINETNAEFEIDDELDPDSSAENYFS